jgi:peptidyl-prolyl cis-trans isomerase C
MLRKVKLLIITLGLLIQVLLISACSDGTTIVISPESPTDMVIPSEVVITPTLTPFSPSATPVELAAQVNGVGISLEEYQAELSRFHAVSESGLVTYPDEKVLEDLIDQVLLGQGAYEAGFSVDEATIQDRIDQLEIGEQELQDWIIQNGYSEASFRDALIRSISAAWMRDQLATEVPTSTEQVHARQILLYNSSEADQVYDQLKVGTEFGTLVAQYEPLTLGDLGWFPRGYLTVPELDDVIFALEPGEYSPIIQTSLGYHIVQVIERQSLYPLSPGAYRVMQTQAIQDWLDERRSQSEIIIFLP